MQLRGSVALVTGAASGLGLATTRRLVDGGAHVVAVDLPGKVPEADSASYATSGPNSPQVRPVAADVTDEAQVDEAVAAAMGLGPLRVVVNCAGIAPAVRLLGKAGVHPLEDFTRCLAVNVTGSFNVARLAAAAMVETDLLGEERGVIVSTASVAAFDGQIGQVAYSASKGAIAAMTLPLARDLASKRIRVMTIAPGIMDTPMLAGLPQAARESLGTQVPHPARLGKPEEYAELVAHIVANPLLNGEVIRLDGAIRMAPR